MCIRESEVWFGMQKILIPCFRIRRLGLLLKCLSFMLQLVHTKRLQCDVDFGC